MTRVEYSVAGLTDTGKVRQTNEDSFLVSADKRLFVVADGQPSGDCGATASRIAIETLKSLWSDLGSDDLADDTKIRSWLQQSLTSANVAIWKDQQNEKRGGSTSIVASIQADDKIHIAHVGVSRAYIMRNGEFKALTLDHDVVTMMIQAGRFSEEQVKEIKSGKIHSCPPSIITRSLGNNDEVEIDLIESETKAGDWLLLCTDGLFKLVQEERIGQVLNTCATADEACKQLLESTFEEGAHDNVTIIAVKYGNCDKTQEMKARAVDCKPC
ncbi:MAG: protein phosphatase 2C domain-containing protein [Cyanobacteria bacterium]|nr:protein phosphatase 2C domain-containing protein [Cyanobacteriota bacterium]